MKATCPICGVGFEREASDSLPFCSARCKLVDLGNWLDERYRVPTDDEAEADAAEDRPGRRSES